MSSRKSRNCDCSEQKSSGDIPTPPLPTPIEPIPQEIQPVPTPKDKPRQNLIINCDTKKCNKYQKLAKVSKFITVQQLKIAFKYKAIIIDDCERNIFRGENYDEFQLMYPNLLFDEKEKGFFANTQLVIFVLRKNQSFKPSINLFQVLQFIKQTRIDDVFMNLNVTNNELGTPIFVSKMTPMIIFSEAVSANAIAYSNTYRSFVTGPGYEGFKNIHKGAIVTKKSGDDSGYLTSEELATVLDCYDPIITFGNSESSVGESSDLIRSADQSTSSDVSATRER